MRSSSRSCVHFVLAAKAGDCQAMVIRASEPAICKSIDGHFETSWSEVGSWHCVGSLSTHFEMVSHVVRCYRNVQRGRGRTELVRQGILASSRYPAKGIRRRDLFKVDSAGKRRLLHWCHRSDMD